MSVVGAVSAGAQTASTFYGFGGAASGDGDEPTVLIQAQDGNFYGITSYGGNTTGCTDDSGNPTGCGTIFRISPSGAETPLYKFPGAVGGATPNKYGGIPSSLIQGPDGNIYGTTLIGGLVQSQSLSCQGTSGAAVPCCVDANSNAVGCGTIFEFSPTQAATITPNILYTFSGSMDGGAPGNLILGENGSQAPVVYGTTLTCSNCQSTSGGTVFSITPAGAAPVTPTPVVSFVTPGTFQALPNSLIQANQNTFYGTTQMGGGGSCLNDLGCGGIFQINSSGSSSSIQDLWYFSGNDSPSPADAKITANAALLKHPAGHLPQIVVAQSGSRFPVEFPFDFSPAPISLAMDNLGDVYGTTPPVCLTSDTVGGNPSAQYLPVSSCNTSSGNYLAELQSSIFQLIPGGGLNILYTFSGNGPAPQSPPPDGGGSVAGVTLATDGNFYGLSGDGSTTGELYNLQVQNQSITEYARINPSLNPNWMIQGADGNFYGTSSAGYSGISCGLPCGPPPHFYGSVFEVAPLAPLPAPVQLTLSQSPIPLGQSSNLSWAVPNANSLTSQQCFAFIEGTNASTAGHWTQASMKSATTIAGGALSGSLSISPTAEGTYTYALTCGGIVSGQATLQVNTPPPLTISPTIVPDATAGIAYSATLTASGGSGSGYTFSITSGSGSLAVFGLNVSASGVISGTPPGAGTASFTVKLTDSLGNTASQSYTLTVNTVTAPYAFKGMSASPSDGNGPTMVIQAQDGNFYGITSFGGGGGKNCVNNAGAADGCGTIFRFIPGATQDTVLHSFAGTNPDGGIPTSIIQGQDGNIYVTTMIGGPDSGSSNPNSTALNICTDTNGPEPCCTRSYFSGTTLTSSPIACGAIFEFNPSQAAPVTLNPLYTFIGGTDGASPGTLILGSTGPGSELIFGTTLACNSSDCKGSAGYNIFGTVFDFVPEESTPVTPTTIVTFPPSSSSFSLAYPNSLIQSGADTLYGTTQMGGDSSTTTPVPCPDDGTGTFGCGGVFEVNISAKTIAELCDFGDNTCSAPVAVADRPIPVPARSSERIQPEIVVAQSGSRFPVGGNQWGYSTAPIALTMDSSGSIYGTTPPGCAGFDTTTNMYVYSLDPNCSSTNGFETSSVFKLVQPVAPSTTYSLAPAPSSSPLSPPFYSFTGDDDGGGTAAGLMYAADGNLYGASGFGSSTSEVFTVTSSGISSYATLNSAYTPTWLILGSDGNLYGTSSTGGGGFGAFFEVTPPTPLPLPVQLSFLNSQINLGSEATLTWNVPNAYSLSSQECYPFVQPNQTGAGTWSAPATSPAGLDSVSDGVYSNSATITPTKTGTFHYAVTCGGMVSGFATLQVTVPALTISPTSLPAGTAGTLYSETLTPGGGSGTGYQFSITVGAASLSALGLSLSTAGAISGTPIGGTANFTVQLVDSLSDSTMQAYTLTVNKVTPTITWSPASTIIYGSAGTTNVLTANANGVSGSFTYSATPTGGGSPINISSGTSGLAVGSYTIAANFTPTNSNIYSSAQSTATLVVSGECVWIVNSTSGTSELAGNGAGITSSADPGANLAVAIDSSGNVWTVGSGSTLLEETSQLGTSLTTIAAGTGGLNSPSAIAIDGNSQIWVTNGDNSVSLFSNAGSALSPTTGYIAATLSAPSGIAVDLSGNVWITNKGSNSVTMILGAAAPAAPLATAVANKTTGEKP
jgi:Putative Ig domain